MSSSLSERRGRKSPTLNVDDAIINIEDIVNNYFVLNDSIKYYDTNLGSVYRSIYTTFTGENSKFVFNNIDDIDLTNTTQLGSIKQKNSEHRSILPGLDESFKLPPIKIELTSNQKYIIKTFTLVDGNNEDILYIQQLMLVIREICMQLYGYYLNSIRPLKNGADLVVIPKIYYVQREENSIFVCMEYIPPINEILTFEKWDLIIKDIFSWFESNKLYHHDTAHRNIYLCGTKEDIRLAVIDFGEAYVNYDNMDNYNKTEAQPSGYFKDQTQETFRLWVDNKIDPNYKSHEIYGGGIKSIKHKKRKKITKQKSKKNRRDTKSKKNKYKK